MTDQPTRRHDADSLQDLEPPGVNEMFAIEAHGIDYIPETHRTGKPSSLFWIWLGAQTNVFPVIFGALLVSFGLSFWAAVSAIVVANLFWPLVGIIGASGPRGGTATFMISRTAFGRRGNLVPAALNWLTVMGWEAAGIIIATLSFVSLADFVGLGHSSAVKAGCLVVTMLVVYGVGIWGHATIAFLQTWASRVLLVLAVVIAVPVFKDAHLGAHSSTTLSAWTVGLTLMLAGVPFSWLNFPAEYHRYLPSDTSVGRQVWWTTLGGFIPGVFMSVIGAAAGTASRAVLDDPVSGIQHMLPGGLVVPFLIVVVLGMIANDVFSTYSSGLGLQILGVKLPRHKAVVIDAVVAGAVAVWAVFFHDFYDLLTTYLALMIVWIAPWAGVFIVNLVLRRNRYPVRAMYEDISGGAEPAPGGWNYWALASWLVAVGIGSLFVNSSVYVGPLARQLGGADLSGLVGIVAGAVLYAASLRLTRRPGTVASAPATLDAERA